MLMFNQEEFDDQILAGVELMMERVEALPAPAILEDMFPEAGIGMIWIPAPVGQDRRPVREWTALENEQVRLAEEVVGKAIEKEMSDTQIKIIQKVFDDGTQAVLYRREVLEEAKRISGIGTVL